MNRLNSLRRMKKHAKIRRSILVMFCFLLLLSPFGMNVNGSGVYVQAEEGEPISEANDVSDGESVSSEADIAETETSDMDSDELELVEEAAEEADEEQETGANDEEIVPGEDEAEQVDQSDEEAVSPDEDSQPEDEINALEEQLQSHEDVQVLASPSVFKTLENSNGTLTITEYNGTETDVTIPSEIEGKKVTGIGERAFSDKGLTNVVLPNTVVTIGTRAFELNKLTAIIIPNTVQSVAQYAFANNEIADLHIGSGLTEIRYGVFADNNLVQVTIPDNISNIHGQAFLQNNLETIILPETVKEIGSYAFAFNALTNVSIPASVEKIGSDAFRVNELEVVTVKNPDVELVGDAIFANNPAGLTIRGYDPSTAKDYADMHGYSFHTILSEYETVELPDGTLWIDTYNGSDTDVTIPSEIDGKVVTVIGIGAFIDKGLTKVTIPNTVTTISSDAFRNNALTEIHIPSSVEMIGQFAFGYNQLTELVIPDTVSWVAAYGFSYNQLTDVKIGNGLTMIDIGTFYENNLIHVIIPDTVTHIRTHAFAFNDLETVHLPSELQEIGLGAFFRNNLTSVTLPKSVESIHDSAFYLNHLLTEVIVKNPHMLFDGEDIFYSNVRLKEDLVLKGFDPSTAKEYATTHGFSFQALQIFETVENNDGTLTITGYNGNDKDLTIPSEIDGKTVTAIGKEAFKDKRLTNIVLPNTIVTLEDRAFQGNKLTALTIPDSVQTMTYYTFAYNEIEHLTLGSGLTKIDTGVFRENKLTNVMIPDNITTIHSQAFVYNGIQTVTFPETLWEIGTSAFEGNQLTNISIPANVGKINDSVFRYNELVKVTIQNPNTAFEGDRIFEHNQANPADLTIYGYDPSTAKDYAKLHNYTFIAFSSIISVKALDDIEVDFGTLAADIPLPTEVEIEIVNGNTLNVPITWEDPLPYDGEKSGSYPITGQLDVPDDISNPSHLATKVTVIVKEAVEAEKRISARYYGWVPLKTGYYDQTDLPLPDKVEVSLHDGTKVELEVIWRMDSDPVYDKDTVGNYLFSGELQLIDGITNPYGHLAQRLFVLTDAVVIAKYEDGAGNELAAEETFTGKVNDEYTTTAKDIAGYTLTETPTNANGTFTVRDITVTYVYSKDSDEKPDKEIIGAHSLGTMEDVGAKGLAEIRALLPEKVTVILDDQTEVELRVAKWNADSVPAYNKDTAGMYIFSGDLDLPDGIANTAGIRATYSLSLNEIDDPNVDRVIVAPYYAWTPLKTGHYEQEVLPLPKAVQVSLDDGSKVSLEIEWQPESNPVYDKNVPGDYLFKGEFKLADGIKNPHGHIPQYMFRLTDSVVFVKYVDEQGQEVAPTETFTGQMNDPYTTEAKDIDGYTLTETPTNASGKFQHIDVTVTYVYSKDSTEQPSNEIIGTISEGATANVGKIALADVQSLMPDKVKVMLDDGSEVELFVTWDADSVPSYDKDTIGIYVFSGKITLTDGIVNNAGIRAHFTFSLTDDTGEVPVDTDKEISNVPVIGTAIEVGTKDVSEVQALFPSTVDVRLDDGSIVELGVHWSKSSTPAYDMNEVGTYVFRGELVLTDGITNPFLYEIEYWVTLIDRVESDDQETEEKTPVDDDSDESIVSGNSTDKKESLDKEKSTTEKTDDGKTLPKTATAYFTFILAGFLLIILGGAIYATRRKRQME